MMLLQRAGDPDIRRCLGLTALHYFDGKPATDAPTMPYSCQIQLHSCPGRHSTSERGLRLPLLIGGLLLALCGCAVPGSRSAMPLDVDVPATWSVAGLAATQGASPLADWWLRFDDPLLAMLVTKALQANTSVRTAEAALRQARALRDVAAAGLWPVFGSSAAAKRSKSGDNDATSNFTVGLDASWELDIFGANRSALNAGEATARASAANLGDVQVSIAAEMALAYITLRSAQARLAIAEGNLASQQETLQITQWRLQAGLVSSLDTEQALGATEQTQAKVPLLQTSIEQSRHAIAVLTGQPPAALAAVLAAGGTLPRAAADLALGIPAETLRQRPDVRAAEHRVTAAAAQLAQADAARLPSFKLGGSLGFSAMTLGALGNSASLLGTLLASVSLPVFDGGASRAQVRAQQAALDQAILAYQAVVLTALRDVEDALVALRGERQRQARLQLAAAAAGRAAQMARQRYSSGLVDFQTVLETQRSQLATEDSVVSSGADLGADHVRLYKALGGGWIPDAADPGDDRNENAARTFRP
jgi:multidrug efflux system outer membrane protein